MSNILQSLTDLLTSSVDGSPEPPAILTGLRPRLAELTAVSVDPTGDGVDRWLTTLRSITSDDGLHDTLLVRTVQMHFPRLAELLTMLKIFDFEWQDNVPLAFHIDWTQLTHLTSDPGATALRLMLGKVTKLSDVKALEVLILLLVTAPQPLLELEYRGQGFAGLPLEGVPGVTSTELTDLVTQLVHSPVTLALPVPVPLTLAQFRAAANPAVPGAQGLVSVDGPATFNGLDGLVVEAELTQPAVTVATAVEMGGGWTLTVETSASASATFGLRFSASGLEPAPGGRAEVGVFLGRQPAGSALLLGDPDGTHLAIKTVSIGLRFRSTGPVYDVVLALHGVEFVLKPDFLSFLSFGLDIPARLTFTSDVDIVYTQGQGLSGQGVSGGPVGLSTQFATPVNLKIGGAGAGVDVDQVITRMNAALDRGRLVFRVQLRYSAKAQFGPLGATMDGAGVWLGRWLDGNGGLLPPEGIGLTLDAGPVSGGGYLKIISANEFAGALQVKVLGIGAFAYGLYKALPSGDPSVVALIGIRLPLPGVQLGFGFAVSGFGGLVGINRRADTDLLRERLADGSTGDVLFNDDPMRNAPKLLGDMQRFFPDEQGVFLVGPTLQLNWLAILKLDVGLFIELPGPRKIFLAGSARLIIGSEEFALVYLRLDFIGGIDLTKSLVFFDAVLVNSSVLGIFRITGGVALRIAYGDNGYFLFSMGGFHPSFNPGAMELPKVPRVGVSMSIEIVWLKQEMYLAITSNTFQLGSRVEAGIEIGPISAHGWFGFDALIQFHPFYFIGHVDAGFDVAGRGRLVVQRAGRGQAERSGTARARGPRQCPAAVHPRLRPRHHRAEQQPARAGRRDSQSARAAPPGAEEPRQRADGWRGPRRRVRTVCGRREAVPAGRRAGLGATPRPAQPRDSKTGGGEP